MKKSMIMKLIANVFINNYAKELRTNDIKSLIEHVINNFNYDIWKAPIDALSKLGDNLDKIYFLLYIFFLEFNNLNIMELNLNIPEMELNLQYFESLDASKTVNIYIPKNIGYKLSILPLDAPGYFCNIYFDNSISSIPQNLEISCSWYPYNPTNIYLPDNLTGIFNILKLIPTCNYYDPKYPHLMAKIYFKPVDRGEGIMGSKFDILPIYAKHFSYLFRVKK